MKEKETIYINLYGAPGSGKTTTMAGVFHGLQMLGYECEMVTEFAKDLVWEERHKTFQNEIYIFAKQHHKLFRLDGEVDIVVTDRPLLLTTVYNTLNGGAHNQFSKLNDLVVEQYLQNKNIDIYIERAHAYSNKGRNQTQEQADIIASMIKDMFSRYGVPHHRVTSSPSIIDDILRVVERELFYYRVMQQTRELEKEANAIICLDRLYNSHNYTIEEYVLNINPLNPSVPSYTDYCSYPGVLFYAGMAQHYVNQGDYLCSNCNERVSKGFDGLNHTIWAHCDACGYDTDLNKKVTLI